MEKNYQRKINQILKVLTARIKEAHKNQNLEEIDKCIEGLNKSWEAASQEVYKATQEQQGQQGQQGGPKSKSDTGNKSSSNKKR